MKDNHPSLNDLDIFIARQPIFDADYNVVSYELLFRDGLSTLFSHQDPTEATSKVLADSFLLFGVHDVAEGKTVFINVTREILLEKYIMLLPPDSYAVEVLADIKPDDPVISACRELKEKGYQIVLDDFVYKPELDPLVELADMIKLDVLSTSKSDQQAILDRFGDSGIEFIAEKVETIEAFQEAVAMGYSQFQGYFFSEPAIMSRKKIPGIKIHYMQILQQINQPNLNLDKIEDIIKKDLSLAYSILRYINSSFFSLPTEIKSIRHALIVLGEKEVKKWACLITLSKMGEDKPRALLSHILLRAKFCEALAPMVGLKEKDQDLFLMGMFSLINSVIGRPVEEILTEIPIGEEIKAAIFGSTNKYHKILQLVIAYERGDWHGFANYAKKLNVPEAQIPNLYINSLIWANSPFIQ